MARMVFQPGDCMAALHNIMPGHSYLGQSRCRFCVWAPGARHVDVHVVAPHDRIVALSNNSPGYHRGILENCNPGDLYLYRLDGNKERPDPASRFQPQGVHGPSQVVDAEFPWADFGWRGRLLHEYVLYELHVGAFTPEGTFDAIIDHLGYLKDLGITAIEIMPVAQFPGNRNWGYDGVFPYAVQNSYGGPGAFKRLINACHLQSIAVVLDVVYNHLGPEGNYLADFGPYFTDKYKTPWGPAINLDGPHSDEVRRFLIQNALYWVTEFHIDGLRIDAVHGIFDFSARHFLEELTDVVHSRAKGLNRHIQVMAESDLNDSRLIRSQDLGGYGLDAQWNDDFHHALHTLLTKDHAGYYEDFGKLRHMVKAFREGFVYSGDYSAYRKRRHGNYSGDMPTRSFVVFSQNHDQVGNRLLGDRLTRLLTTEGLKLAAGTVLLSPFVPLLFMGEEYGETAPFPYFVSHSDPNLIEAVRRGRREEFSAFQWSGEPPDPQHESTFLSAKLDCEMRHRRHHKAIYDFYRNLMAVRKDLETLRDEGREHIEVFGWEPDKVLLVRRWNRFREIAVVFHFGETETSLTVPMTKGRWDKRLDSAEQRWHGSGSLVPQTIDSEGEISFTAGAYTVLVFIRHEEV